MALTLSHSPREHSPCALPSVAVCKEPEVPEDNVSAQGCQKAGWYMVLKDAHVFVCVHMYTCLYMLVHGMSVCVAERKRTHVQPGLLEHIRDKLLVGAES